jgi:predicted patatin/cPLA2 family phospholipase
MVTDSIKETKECAALVVEGGAMRGIFSTGVLDAFLEKNFNPFQICIGVSAGSTNLAAYLAGMYKRNYKVYTDYSLRPEFISWKKFIKGSHLVDLDWLWDITIKELRLKLDNIINSKKEFYIGVTEAFTGKAVYLKPQKDNLEEMIKASSSIPIFYRKFIQLDGTVYTDGGLADPIPVMEAYRLKAKKIMVLRSRPYSYTMKNSSGNLLSKLYLKEYPKLVESIVNRPKVYKESIDFMRKPPKGVQILEINPPESFKTGRLTKDIDILKQDYELGYNIGLDIVKQWQSE